MNIRKFAEKVIKAEEEAFQKGNFDLLKALEDPNVVYHMYQRSTYIDIVGHEAHKQDIISSQQGRTFTKLEFQYLTGEGKLFALSLKTNARVTGEKQREPVSVGKNISGDYLVICRVKKGKVIEGWANGNVTISD